MRKMGWNLEGRQDLDKQRMKGRQSGQEGPHTHTHTHTDLKVGVSKVCACVHTSSLIHSLRPILVLQAGFVPPGWRC